MPEEEMEPSDEMRGKGRRMDNVVQKSINTDGRDETTLIITILTLLTILTLASHSVLVSSWLMVIGPIGNKLSVSVARLYDFGK